MVERLLETPYHTPKISLIIRSTLKKTLFSLQNVKLGHTPPKLSSCQNDNGYSLSGLYPELTKNGCYSQVTKNFVQIAAIKWFVFRKLFCSQKLTSQNSSMLNINFWKEERKSMKNIILVSYLNSLATPIKQYYNQRFFPNDGQFVKSS